MLIEQAVFTSTQSDRLAGYQLVAQSPGITQQDLQSLAVWGPSHDSLLESGADAVSLNFHSLPSGAYCVSRTTPAGAEYSGRAGLNIYTQCLVVPAPVLARFSNNPFALLTAAFAQGSLRVHEKMPTDLEPFRLCGRASAVDQALLAQLLADPGVSWLRALVEAAIGSPSLALSAGAQRPRLIAGLFNLLPTECRTEFSFSTGLRYSPRRPFRVVCVGPDANQRRRLQRQANVTLLDLESMPPQQWTTSDGWAEFIACAVAAGKTSFLASQLSQPRPGLTVDRLSVLGVELLALMADSATTDPSPQSLSPRPVAADPPVASAPSEAAAAGAIPVEPSQAHNRADSGHARFQRTLDETVGPATAVATELDPSQALAAHCPAALEKLERLDDVVFEAIAGKPGALAALREMWPDMLAQLGVRLVEESREQYLRHALRVWRDCVDGDQISNPALAVSAMDVVCLLFTE